MYLIFPVIVLVVLVISAKFILYLHPVCAQLKGKHCQDHYDYDRKNKIQSQSYNYQPEQVKTKSLKCKGIIFLCCYLLFLQLN